MRVVIWCAAAAVAAALFGCSPNEAFVRGVDGLWTPLSKDYVRWLESGEVLDANDEPIDETGLEIRQMAARRLTELVAAAKEAIDE